MKIKALILSSVVLLANCGGGGSDSPSTLTGVFIDSPVINIGYRTATQNGDTNSRGEFKYLAGETVEISHCVSNFHSLIKSGATNNPIRQSNTQKPVFE